MTLHRHFTCGSAARQEGTLPAALPSRLAGGADAFGVHGSKQLRRWAITVVLSMTAVCASAADWLIVPGKRAGPIDAQASEAKLVESFGAANVKRESFEVEPGVAIPATIVFADDPTRRAMVLWRDETRTGPESVVIRGERSVWRTDRGITLGTPLATLRRINGRPLTLIGFGSDVGGTVLDNGGGALAELGAPVKGERVGRTLVLRVEPDPSQRDSPAYQQAIGDVELSSESDAMRMLNPRVFQLMVDIATK
jgi:hypothetical protein